MLCGELCNKEKKGLLESFAVKKCLVGSCVMKKTPFGELRSEEMPCRESSVVKKCLVGSSVVKKWLSRLPEEIQEAKKRQQLQSMHQGLIKSRRA